MKRTRKSKKSKSLIAKILSFFSKTNKIPEGNNFDLWDKENPPKSNSKSDMKKNIDN